MIRFWLAFCCALCFMGWVSADPVVPFDPRIVVGGGGLSTSVPGLSFIFTANGDGGGFLTFRNDSGVTWTNLHITTDFPGGVLATDYVCDGFDFFATCSFATDGSTISIWFTGVGLFFEEEFFPGIEDGEEFFINLNNLVGGEDVTRDPEGEGGWIPGSTFRARANVPEPGSFVLLGTGLSGLLTVRLLRRKRQGAKTAV